MAGHRAFALEETQVIIGNDEENGGVGSGSGMGMIAHFGPGLGVDCLASGCSGERSLAAAELAGFYGHEQTVGQALHWMRCGCGALAEVVGVWRPVGTGRSRCGWQNAG